MSKPEPIILNEEYAIQWRQSREQHWLKIFPFFTDDDDDAVHESLYGGSVVLDETAQEALYRLLARQRHDRAAAEDQGMLDRKKTQ